MDDMKLRLNATVAEKLGAAPASADKDELIEELSDNLYRRFLDMTGAGVPEEEAFHRALEDLGDVDELLAYLGVEPNADVVVDREGNQTRIETRDGQRILINGADDGHIVINTGDAAQEEPEAPQEEAQAAPEGRTDGHGDTHYDYRGEIPQSDLDAIFANVSEICNIAVEQAREAVKQAKEAIKRRTTVERNNGRVKVHFNTTPDDIPGPPPPPAPPAPPEPPEAPEPPTPPAGWEFEAELNSDEGRFFAGAGPKQRKDVVYGFGYDKAKGGFFAQWGEYKGGSQGDPQEGRGPYFSGADAAVRGNDDGTYSVTALRDLRGIEVFTVAGDVTICDSEAPDAGVIIDGDVDDLDVTCSADGILTIREGRTASSSFFSRRGIGSADVELCLPRRHWELISVSTTSGDVELGGSRLDIDQLCARTASGDVSLHLNSCRELCFHSASGDMELDLKGGCASLQADTASGDITLQGQVENASLKTASGDVELEGAVRQFRASSMSGDVRLETSQMPAVLEMSSKSGDCEARIPDAGPFTLRMKTINGEMDCEFRMNYINGMLVYGDGSGPSYSITSVSGDVSLERG